MGSLGIKCTAILPRERNNYMVMEINVKRKKKKKKRKKKKKEKRKKKRSCCKEWIRSKTNENLDKIRRRKVCMCLLS